MNKYRDLFSKGRWWGEREAARYSLDLERHRDRRWGKKERKKGRCIFVRIFIILVAMRPCHAIACHANPIISKLSAAGTMQLLHPSRSFAYHHIYEPCKLRVGAFLVWPHTQSWWFHTHACMPIGMLYLFIYNFIREWESIRFRVATNFQRMWADKCNQHGTILSYYYILSEVVRWDSIERAQRDPSHPEFFISMQRIYMYWADM